MGIRVYSLLWVMLQIYNIINHQPNFLDFSRTLTVPGPGPQTETPQMTAFFPRRPPP